MDYLRCLSKAQWMWLVGTLAAGIALVTIGWALEPESDLESSSGFTTAMSIKDIAPRLDVTGKALARELGLPLDVPKGKPLKALGIDQSRLDHVTAHLLEHRTGNLKYYVFAALVLWGLIFLVRLGRPDRAPNTQRRMWYPSIAYLVAPLVAVLVCGFALGKSPNPMEGAVKMFKSLVGLYPSVWDKVIALAFFLGLAIVGNKLVCGWACPFGALQELLYSLPILKRVKRRKIPFLVSNAVRTILFAVMLMLLFGVVGGRKGFVLYHFVNPFNLFGFEFDYPSIGVTVLAALGLSVLTYRPFCQFICPFGLISWLAERLSLARVRIDPTRCNGCGACVRACPSDAAKDTLAGKLFAADCYSCARCLNVCPHEAITYGLGLGREASGNRESPAMPS